MMNSKNIMSTLLLSLVIALTGCANRAGNSNMEPPPPGVTSATLVLLGSPARTVNEYVEEQVQVRYLDQDGLPVADATVQFELQGEPGGASLSASASATDSDGVATVVVRTGQLAQFDFVASAPIAADVKVAFDVQQMRFGDLSYRLSYGGTRLVRTGEVALFTNTTCANVALRTPLPNMVQTPRIATTSTFNQVEIGAPMAVYALGIDNRDQVAAEACADVTLTEASAHSEILLVDVAEILGGRYQVEETFDVTAGLPERLDRTLDFFYGMGTNPGLWIVDFVAEQTDTPRWLQTALRFGPTRTAVATILNDAIDDVTVPGYVEDVFDIGAALDTALREMTLVGELSFPEANEFAMGRGQHRIHTMRVPVGDDFSELPVSASATLDVTIGETITLPEHALSIPFGSLVTTLLNDVLLARLPGSPANITELVTTLLDCDAIAMEIVAEPGATADIVNTVCRLGTTILGGVIETEIASLFDYDTLYLQGTANLHDLDGDYDRETIAEGMSTARWVRSASMDETDSLMFPGDMNGTLLDDTTGRTHPVREQIFSLR